jgi:hypothetical protein
MTLKIRQDLFLKQTERLEVKWVADAEDEVGDADVDVAKKLFSHLVGRADQPTPTLDIERPAFGS